MNSTAFSPILLQLNEERLRRLALARRLDLDDGQHRLVLQMCCDDTHINDYDCYGRIEWDHGGRRPAGFDGSARVMMRDRSSRLWWQPYREGRLVYDEPSSRQIVMDLLIFGFTLMSLQLWGPAFDVLGVRHHVLVEEAVMGGVEPTPDTDAITSICSDLLADLQGRIQSRTQIEDPHFS